MHVFEAQLQTRCNGANKLLLSFWQKKSGICLTHKQTMMFDISRLPTLLALCHSRSFQLWWPLHVFEAQLQTRCNGANKLLLSFWQQKSGICLKKRSLVANLWPLGFGTFVEAAILLNLTSCASSPRDVGLEHEGHNLCQVPGSLC